MTLADRASQDNDIRQIHDLITEHSWLLDHGRWHDVADLYTDEARLEIGPTILQGRSAFSAWANGRAADRGRRTHHQCTNIRIARAPDGTVEGAVMLVLHVSTDGGPAAIEFVGEYRDRYCQDSQGRWRFQQRSLFSISDPT